MTNTFESMNKHLEEFRKAFSLPPETDSVGTQEPKKVDYGDCIPGCEICQGVGLIPAGDGWEICPNNPRRFYNSGVNESDTQLWKILPQTKYISQIKRALSKALSDKYGFVFIYGDPGIGKTVCARAFTVEAIQAGMRALYTRQSELVNNLRSSYDAEHGQEEYQARLGRYKNMDWLVIDELGRDRMNDFARESLAEIIDARYTSALSRNKVTVLVSNFAPEEIFQDYITDRVRDKKNVVLALQGRSLRL